MFQPLIHISVAKEARWQSQAPREAPPLTSLPSVKNLNSFILFEIEFSLPNG
jgi:hypothetical protein